ncbi:MAG: hypothetical protein E6G50_09465 [Actinobacteria bacterium]|nr:MAG: hypothetical protein E6G50_09465 [Actinomycetota bacterium]
MVVADELELALELLLALLPPALFGAQLLQLASRLVQLARACLGGAEGATRNLQFALERRLACISLGAASLRVLLGPAQQIVTLRNLGLGLAESAAREVELAFELPYTLLALSLFGLQPIQFDARVLELARQCLRLGTTRSFVLLEPAEQIVTLRNLGLGLAESAARVLELALDLPYVLLALLTLSLQLVELEARVLELAGQCLCLGTTRSFVLLEPAEQIVTLGKLGLGFAESAARELEVLLEL